MDASESERASVAGITPLSARMEVAGSGYAPLEEYPGITTAKWKARHLECGNEVSIRLHVLRQGRGCCMPCGAKKHGSTRSLDPGKAFEAMLSANLEPLEPYPGSVGKAWKSRCLVCGDIVAPPVRERCVWPGRLSSVWREETCSVSPVERRRGSQDHAFHEPETARTIFGDAS